MKESTRQLEIKALATGLNTEPAHIAYTLEEEGVWQTITEALAPIWEECVAPKVLEASQRLALPKHKIPQLAEVTQSLDNLTGFKFRAVGGLAPRDDFFAGLANQQFLSTQFIRGAENPFYTEQPDIVHELIGHATLLADPDFAELHRSAGAAITRLETEVAKRFIANVWWFSGEFGAVRAKGRLKAIGAGILSSLSELEHFADAEVRPLDTSAMGQLPYHIDRLQPVLFVADSTDHFVNEVGTFFETVTDNTIHRLTKETRHGI